MSVHLPDDVAARLKNSADLIPAIAQDSDTGEVLMLAYMNTQSLALTLETGRATYWSRSRNELWEKGATSGHTQKVISISLDCDGDALLLQVQQVGGACHTGEKTCFHNPISLPTKSGEEK
jgi:phosphoribosyl-AMP cyclohydrolase